MSDVADTGTSSGTVAVKNHVSSFNGMLTATKDVRKWNTSFSLNVNAMLMNRETRRQGADIKVGNGVYIFTGKVETHQFNDVLAGMFNVSYTLNRVTFKGVANSDTLDELTVNGKVSLFPVKSLELYGKVYLNRSKIDDSQHKTNLFVDAGARYSLGKFDIELTAKNLSNMKEYSYTLYRSLDIVSYRYTLRPLELLLSLRYNF